VNNIYRRENMEGKRQIRVRKIERSNEEEVEEQKKRGKKFRRFKEPTGLSSSEIEEMVKRSFGEQLKKARFCL
jgi:hypothetical protein